MHQGREPLSAAAWRPCLRDRAFALLILAWCVGCQIGRPPPNGAPADSGAACGDLQADPRNCGACGYDCEGGACHAGTCEPLEPGVLATGQAQPGPMVVDDTSVYWANVGAPAILKCKKTGCGNAPTVLVEGYPAAASNLVLHDEVLYWGAGPAVYTCPVGGCGGAPRRLPVGGLVGPVAVAPSGDVYYVQQVGRTTLGACPAGDCARATTVPWIPGSGVPYAADMFAPIASAIALDGTNLYVLAATLLPGLLTTCAVDACATTARTLFVAANGGPPVIAVDADNVYVALSDPQPEIEFIPKGANPNGGFPAAGNDRSTVLVTGLAAPSAIATDGISVYWADLGPPTEAGMPGAGTIAKCSVSGCNWVAKTVRSFVSSPAGIAVDEGNVYWTELGAGSDPFSGRVVYHAK